MGKQSRRARQTERAQVRRQPEAAAVASAAEELADAIVEGAAEVLSRHGKRLLLDPDAVDDVRASYLAAGYRWPTWSYLPGAVLAAALIGQAGIANPSARTELTEASMGLAAVAAWWPGRIAVRFDGEVLAELEGSPLDGELPVELLERLPAWGLYLDCPHLGAGVGVMACVDPEAITSPSGEVMGEGREGRELWLAVRLPEGPAVTTSVWLGRGSIPIALRTQEAEADRKMELAETRSLLESAFGRPYRTVISGVVSMLLYLCASDADLSRHRVPLPRRRGNRPAPEVEIVNAGFRIGAALRQARSTDPGEEESDGGGRSPAPHIRSAHFHSYWLGPLSQPSQRRLELRWLPPIPVNLDRGQAEVVVRKAQGPVREF